MLHLRFDLIALAAVSACGIGFFIWTLCQLLSDPRPGARPAETAGQTRWFRELS